MGNAITQGALKKKRAVVKDAGVAKILMASSQLTLSYF
jgi:hypothetical protein